MQRKISFGEFALWLFALLGGIAALVMAAV